MKKLIIKAHPSPNGLVHEIAQTITKSSTKDEVRVIDLYAEKFDFLQFTSESELPHKKEGEKWRELIKWADEFNFIFPIWWYDAPAILKNFFDITFVSHTAFVYQKNGIPKGLMPEKTARFFCTSGAPAWIYNIPCLFPVKKMWKARVSFCGIKTKSFLIFGNRPQRNPQNTQKFLAKVKEIASSS